MSVSYEFYTTAFCGSAISEADWPSFEVPAEAQARRFERIYTVTVPSDYDEETDPDPESMAVCALAECLQSFAMLLSGNGAAVSSASIGSVSVSYSGAALGALDLSEKGQERELYRTFCKYMDVYRGVSSCG